MTNKVINDARVFVSKTCELFEESLRVMFRFKKYEDLKRKFFEEISNELLMLYFAYHSYSYNDVKEARLFDEESESKRFLSIYKEYISKVNKNECIDFSLIYIGWIMNDIHDEIFKYENSKTFNFLAFKLKISEFLEENI